MFMVCTVLITWLINATYILMVSLILKVIEFMQTSHLVHGCLVPMVSSDGGKKMTRILVTGATGTVGKALQDYIKAYKLQPKGVKIERKGPDIRVRRGNGERLALRTQ